MTDGPHQERATFGDLLRRHRIAADLTQEALAERAGLSTRGISDLERGARTHPYRETVNMLAAALALAGNERAAFVEAARRPARSMGHGRGDRRASTLPTPMTKLIGRQAEIAAVGRLLADDRVRLVTLTGPGGVGKTRLALAVAEETNGIFPGGTVFVDLSPLNQSSNVAAAVASALGLTERMDASLMDSLHLTLGERKLLVVLDNYEHLMDAAPVVSDLLRASTNVKVLVTSREALRLQGEREFLVPPLALPDLTQDQRLELLTSSSAVRLFAERAAEADPSFTLTGENAPTVAAICRRLDGLPLAIELAAARTKVLPLEALLARLEQRLPLLTGGPRDAPARQRTLRDAIAWSYDLCTPAERVLFARLGAFAGGWTLEAAETVSRGVEESRGRDDPSPITHHPLPDTLSVLSSLVDKSLAWRVNVPAGTRFTMLETIREFAQERLRADYDDDIATRTAHAEFFLALAEEARVGLVGEEQEVWLARLDAEDGNLRTALAWTDQHGTVESSLRFARALWRYWSPRGRLVDGRFWLERALSRPGADDAPADARADAHNALGNLLGDASEYALARHHYEEALRLRRALRDAEGVAGTLNNLGIIALWLGEFERAITLHRESLETRRAQNDPFGEALSLSNLGDVMLAMGEFTRAREFQEAALQLREQVHDATGSGYTYFNLGDVARLEGDLPKAGPLLAESLRRFEGLGDRLGIAYAEWSLADVASQEGNVVRAADLLERAMETRTEIGDKRGFVECLEALGLAAIREGSDIDGVRLLGAALAQRKALSCPVPPATQTQHDRVLGKAKQRLGSARIQELLLSERLTLEQARALARRVIERLIAAESVPSSPS